MDAAWELARRDGLASLSLRNLAAAVGMRAPSLYTYFPSKNALYDAMYAKGMREFADQLDTTPPEGDARQMLRHRAQTWVRIAVTDAPRYELLFQRPVPGFVPSPESLAIGLRGLARTRELAQAAGLHDERAFDLFMATMRGLVETQLANEPGGERWIDLAGDATDILLAHYAGGSPRATPRRAASQAESQDAPTEVRGARPKE